MNNINQNNFSNDLSPYLKQHKDNPVNWQTWSKETLEEAKKNKKAHSAKYWICQLSLVSCDGS